MCRDSSQVEKSDMHSCQVQMQPGVVVAGDTTEKAARVFGATFTKGVV